MANEKQFFINLEKETEKRYDMSRFMEFTDNFDPLTAGFLRDIKALPTDGYFVVQGEEFRPDAIAHKLYGSTQYWWAVMIYNDLSDINQLTSGISLSYPSLEDLEDAYFKLKSKQSVQDRS